VIRGALELAPGDGCTSPKATAVGPRLLAQPIKLHVGGASPTTSLESASRAWKSGRARQITIVVPDRRSHSH
jgi:hypothetical protein